MIFTFKLAIFKQVKNKTIFTLQHVRYFSNKKIKKSEKKMIFSNEMGIVIDDTLKHIMEKAVKIDGNRLQFSKKIGVSYSVVCNWLGAYKRKGEYIVWDSWKPLREHLNALCLIDKNESRWMLPSEMRESVSISSLAEDEKQIIMLYRRLNEEGKKLATQNITSLAGSNATSISDSQGEQIIA